MFEQQLSEVPFFLSSIIALAAGVLSFLSPCVLPIVPPYLAFMAGLSVSDINGDKLSTSDISRLTRTAVFFVLGLSTVFVMLGLAAAAVGTIFLKFQAQITMISGLLIIAFGLHFLGIFRISFFAREYRFNFGSGGGGFLGAYVLGVAFAFGWTPCIGPILSAILSMSAQTTSLTQGTFLMAIYAIGLGFPFVLSGVFFARAIKILTPLRRNSEKIEKFTGFLLLVVGVLFLTGAFTYLSFWLLEYLPFLALFG